MSTDTTPLTDDLHSAMCRAVASLNEGREQEASAVLRQALVDYADAIAATPKAPDPTEYERGRVAGMAQFYDLMLDAQREGKSVPVPIEVAQRPAQPEGFTACDMATAQASKYREGLAARSVEEPKSQPALDHQTESDSTAVRRPAGGEASE